MDIEEDLKSEARKFIDKENQRSIAEAGVAGGFSEIKGVAFLDTPVLNLIGSTALPSKWERLKSKFKRKPDLNGTISD
jgi:hypothetical protein